MGATYTRQSTITDGAVIEASHFNDEFDQLLASFAVTTGHSHDGTAAEGGPVTKLLGTSLTVGDGTAGTDITLTFDGETNDGVLTWMEDEDLFKFSDDINVGVDDTGYDVKLFGATSGSYFLWDESADSLLLTDSTPLKIGDSQDLTLYHDGSNSYITNAVGALKIATATSGIAVTIGHTTSETTIADNATVTGNLSVGGTFDVTGTIDFSDAAITNAGDIQLDSITGDGDTNTAITFSGSDVITVTAGGDTQFTFNNGSILPTTDNDIDLGSASYEFKDGYFDGTLYADAINFNGTAIASTAAEINILDGDNSASSVTVVDADRIILNDNGTMKQVAVSALNTYTSSSIAADDVSAGDAAVSIATSSGNVTIDSNAGSTTVDGHTGVTLQSSNSGDITLDSVADIVVDAAGGNVEFKDAGTLQFTIDMDGTAGVQIVKLGVDSDDLVFQQYDGSEVVRMADDRRLYFYDKGGEYIYGDGTDLHIVSGADINISANIGLTFGDDGEKIEGDGTDLTISGNNINLTATADVVIPANVGVTFGSGEKIEGDSTDLTITSGAKINLTATSDIVVPANVGITFGTGEKIEGDSTDLTVTSGADINLTATSDINVPANVGITIGNDGEKIEGDGTDLTIASSGVLNLAAGGSTNQIKVTDGAILPITDDDVDLGSASYQFKNAYFDGTLEADAITIGGSAITAGGATAGFALAMAVAL